MDYLFQLELTCRCFSRCSRCHWLIVLGANSSPSAAGVGIPGCVDEPTLICPTAVAVVIVVIIIVVDAVAQVDGRRRKATTCRDKGDLLNADLIEVPFTTTFHFQLSVSGGCIFCRWLHILLHLFRRCNR